MRKRLAHFDVIKLLAILWIFWVHFVADYKFDLFRFWSEPPYSWILSGVTGKLAVAVFAVIIGYFAYGQGGEKGLFGLIIKRYISFFVMGVFINAIELFYVRRTLISFDSLGYLLNTSLMIKEDIYPILWCMKSFLFGSIISYINGKYKLSEIPILLLIAVLVVTNNVWIAICLMGNILWILTSLAERAKKINRWIDDYRVQCALLVMVFFAIKQPETDVAFLTDGACTVLVLMIINTNKYICKLFSNPFLAFCGKSSMGVYLLHPVIYPMVASIMGVSDNSPILLFAAGFIVSVCVTTVLAIVVVRVINKCTDCLYRIVMMLCSRWLSIGLNG